MAKPTSPSTSAFDDQPSRREFLRQAGLTAGGLLILSVPSYVGQWIAGSAAAPLQRVYARGRYGLELDGIHCGFVSSIEGGNITADVVTEAPGPDRLLHKHLAGVKFEPFTIECGLDLAKPWYDWISATLNGQATRKNGAIIALDFNYKEIGRRTFSNAVITEVGFPAFDAASKEPAQLTVTLVPESIRFDPPSQKSALPSAPKAMGQKLWLSSNFRMNIQGLEPSTAKVTKVEAIALKQKMADQAMGQIRDFQKSSLPIEVPNLVISLPESHAGLFYAWHQDFVLKGNNGQDKEKPGVLEFLGPDLKPLAALQFSNLGIFKIAPEPAHAADAIARVKAEMYCEKITATFNV